MKIKTADLIGPALDWAVAKCEGVEFTYEEHPAHELTCIQYSTDWARCGPIIERERISVGWAYSRFAHEPVKAVAQYFEPPNSALSNHRQFGPTPLIAAMRCYVAMKMGEEVEVPEELA
jgi:hypothetical protein